MHEDAGEQKKRRDPECAHPFFRRLLFEELEQAEESRRK